MRLRELVLALCALTQGLQAGPSDTEVEQARKVLAKDQPGTVAGAIETLVQDGSERSLEALADYGAKTLHSAHTRLVGKALPSKSETVAAAQIRRLIAAHKRTPARLARVAVMATQLPGAEAGTILASLAKDKRPRVAVPAIRGLGARGDDGARPLLLGLLKSKRPDVATATATALADLPPDTATMEALFKRLQRSDIGVGGACAVALGRIEGAEPFGDRALALLGKHVKRESFHALVKVTLRLAKNPDPKLLARALKSKSGPVREVACELIGSRKLEGHADQLLRLATSAPAKEWRTRAAAWLALRRSGIEGILPAIRKRIQGGGEPSYWAIQCATRRPHEELVPALRDAALDPEDETRRELAQIALRKAEKSRDATRDFYLQAWTRQRGTPKARAALLGLGNLKDPQSFHALVGLLEKEKKKKYRLWILSGLEKLTGHYYKPDPQVWRDWFEVVQGQVAFDPKPIDRRQNRQRVAKIKKLGISAETEAAVELGLSWLARHQDTSGRWSGLTYHENCVGRPDCEKEGGVRHRELGYTGLAILAFQGAGYTHKDGPYQDAVRRGFEYILAHADYDGSHMERDWTFSYEAAIVCQALADGFALTGDPWLGEAAQHWIDYLAKIQRPGGTWRYTPRSTATDTSVMSWILMACVSARHAGLHVPEQMFVGPDVYLDTVCDPIPPRTFEVFVPDHFRADSPYFIDASRDERGKVREFKVKTWYFQPTYTAAMPAVGILSRIWLGWTRAHPYCVGSANQLLSHVPGYEKGLDLQYSLYPYTWYYGSLAMFQMGGRYWSRWRKECLGDLLKHQRSDGCHAGSWEMPKPQFLSGMAGGGGTVYCTAMAILAFEAFYRYQPYLARFDPRSRKEKAAPK